MDIIYVNNTTTINEDMLSGGFFTGWPNPPSAAMHLEILRNSYCAYMAVDTATGKVVGFINAISDGVLSSYIPLLEVLPKYQGHGIGSKLVQHILGNLEGLYMIDIICDEEITPFYIKHGAMMHGRACIFRNYGAQSGRRLI